MKREITPLGNDSFQISDFRLDNYYIVVGERRAAVIDSGCGLTDPLAEIHEITDLPLTLICTHGHTDHVGNAYQFDDVYMHPADEEVVKSLGYSPDFVKWYVETRAPLRNPGEEVLKVLLGRVPETMPQNFDFRPITGGEKFDLGGRELEIIATPGHTPGSLSVLDYKARLLYTGDALNGSSIIPTKEGGTRDEISQFLESLKIMLAHGEHFDYTCPGHDGVRYDRSLITDYMSLCEGLLSGELKGDYEEIGIRAGKVVRQGQAEFWYEADR